MKHNLPLLSGILFSAILMSSCAALIGGTVLVAHQHKNQQLGYFYDSNSETVFFDEEPLYTLKKRNYGSEASIYAYGDNRELIFVSRHTVQNSQTFQRSAKEQTYASESSTFLRMHFLPLDKEVEISNRIWRDVLVLIHENGLIENKSLNAEKVDVVIQKYQR